YFYYGAVPRNAVFSAMIRLGMPTLERAYRRVLPELAAQLDRIRPQILELPPPPLADDAEARLRVLRDQLVAEGLQHVDQLVDWIRTGDDADLHRIQIRERARVWKASEHELLRTALHATRAGLLDLSWDTICPHCRGMRDETGALAEIKAQGHCETCKLDFGTDTA